MISLDRLKQVIFIGFILLIHSSCNQHQKEIEDLKNEVMGIHDAAMPGWFKFRIHGVILVSFLKSY